MIELRDLNDDDTPARHLATHLNRGMARAGWRIARLGTRRTHRGRGLAATLLLRTSHACAADGLTAVGLEVAPENHTDPLTIYLRTVFRGDGATHRVPARRRLRRDPGPVTMTRGLRNAPAPY
ncbi:GNAT family N-acetyltransferase [Streptomyces sp. NPDC051677]|uniref:GNAT family N-acetyltransferase n=1 Tax=Streptomyces sp. NPDC051677 TaxID=3365669 RepID=UPI0037CFD8D5